MKKIFTLLVAVSCFTVSFAQPARSYEQRNNRRDNHERSVTDYRNDNYHFGKNNQYNYKQNDHGYNDRIYNERQRQIDQVNRDCDQQIYSYRNDRSINNNERNRLIRRMESERSARINSFGTGAIIGVTAGLILGAILSH